jgi:hypothetical protein
MHDSPFAEVQLDVTREDGLASSLRAVEATANEILNENPQKDWLSNHIDPARLAYFLSYFSFFHLAPTDTQSTWCRDRFYPPLELTVLSQFALVSLLKPRSTTFHPVELLPPISNTLRKLLATTS